MLLAESVFCDLLPSFIGLCWRSRIVTLVKVLLYALVSAPFFLLSRVAKTFFTVVLAFFGLFFVVFSLGFVFSARRYFQEKLQSVVQEIVFWIFLPFDLAVAFVRLGCRFFLQKTVF